LATARAGVVRAQAANAVMPMNEAIQLAFMALLLS
jgi:hypothetical protein